MPKKAAKKASSAPNLGPQHVSYAKVPVSLAPKGRVCLYDGRSGLPPTVTAIPAEAIKLMPWVLVHFPSRKALLVKSRKLGMEALTQIRAGKNFEGLVPVEVKPVKKAREPKTTKSKVSEGRARAAAGASQSGGESDPKNKTEPVPIPEGASFDQAMKLRYPVTRLMTEFERLLTAEEEIFDREGKKLGTRPNYTVQFQTLKSLTEWHQGRPGEKEKPPAEKPRMSYEQLVSWITNDTAALEHMESLCKQARGKPAPVKPAEAATPS